MITKDMVKLMCCPTSPSDALTIDIDEQDGDAIVTGKLVCSAQNRSYPIIDGVPDLIPYERLDSNEWKMWNDHLAGFDERQKRRSEKPASVINKLSKVSRPKRPFAAFTGINEGTILDIGCGPGKFRFSFDSEKVNYYGIDPLLRSNVDDFRFVRGLAEYIPFRDGTFTDLVILSAIDHFKDLDSFFKEVIRVLEPHGKLHVLQSIHEIKGPVSAGKMLAHYVKDALDDKATKSKNPDAPKHISEFTTSSLLKTVDKYFDVLAVDHYSAKWYSPKKLFLSLSPKQANSPSEAPTVGRASPAYSHTSST